MKTETRVRASKKEYLTRTADSGSIVLSTGVGARSGSLSGETLW